MTIADKTIAELESEIKRLRGGCPSWCRVQGKHGHHVNWTVHQDALKRIAELEAALRTVDGCEDCGPVARKALNKESAT